MTQVVPICQQDLDLFLELAAPISVEVYVVNWVTYRGMKQRKAELIKARVSTNMKRGIDALARQRGESEAVIVREALGEYLKKSTTGADGRTSLRHRKRA